MQYLYQINPELVQNLL